MALSSFIANCFKYLWVSKMKLLCIPQIFYEDSEFVNHYRQKHPLYVFFFICNFKNLKLLGFLSHRNYPFHCQSPFLPPPYPPPERQLPRASDIGPFGSCNLLSQWRAVPGAKHRNPFCSVPRARKTGSSSGEKGLSLSEGSVKNTWNGAKCQWEKQVLKLRGDM